MGDHLLISIYIIVSALICTVQIYLFCYLLKELHGATLYNIRYFYS